MKPTCPPSRRLNPPHAAPDQASRDPALSETCLPTNRPFSTYPQLLTKAQKLVLVRFLYLLRHLFPWFRIDKWLRSGSINTGITKIDLQITDHSQGHTAMHNTIQSTRPSDEPRGRFYGAQKLEDFPKDIVDYVRSRPRWTQDEINADFAQARRLVEAQERGAK